MLQTPFAYKPKIQVLSSPSSGPKVQPSFQGTARRPAAFSGYPRIDGRTRRATKKPGPVPIFSSYRPTVFDVKSINLLGFESAPPFKRLVRKPAIGHEKAGRKRGANLCHRSLAVGKPTPSTIRLLTARPSLIAGMKTVAIRVPRNVSCTPPGSVELEKVTSRTTPCSSISNSSRISPAAEPGG